MVCAAPFLSVQLAFSSVLGVSQASTGNSLETFDFVELLAMLARSEKTGALRVERDQQVLTLWLTAGRVRHMDGAGLATDVVALAGLLQDPRGRFQFEEGEAAPPPTLDLSCDAFTYEALKRLPPPPLKFAGAGRLESPERLAELSLNFYEQEVLRGVAEGKPLSELAAARDPQAAALLGRLGRLRLIGERRTRVARLLVQLSRRGGAAAVVDESIYQRWRETVGSRIEQIQVRKERGGKVHVVPVISGLQLGTVLELPPELLIRTGLHGGDAVLVRPM